MHFLSAKEKTFPPMHIYSRYIKRVVDFVAALLLLILLSPSGYSRH